MDCLRPFLQAVAQGAGQFPALPGHAGEAEELRPLRQQLAVGPSKALDQLMHQLVAAALQLVGLAGQVEHLLLQPGALLGTEARQAVDNLRIDQLAQLVVRMPRVVNRVGDVDQPARSRGRILETPLHLRQHLLDQQAQAAMGLAQAGLHWQQGQAARRIPSRLVAKVRRQQLVQDLVEGCGDGLSGKVETRKDTANLVRIV